MHEGLRIDVFVVLHEVEPALQALINHAAIISSRQAELWLRGRAEQGASELVQALTFDDQSGRWSLEGLDVSNWDPDVLQAGGLEGFEGEDIADETGRHVRNGPLFEEDQVISNPREKLPWSPRDRLHLVSLRPIAVTGAEAVGPDHRPGCSARLAGDCRRGFDRIDPVLRGDAEEAKRIGFLRNVVGVPVTHLAVFQNAGAVALLGILDLGLAGGGVIAVVRAGAPERAQVGRFVHACS